MREGPPFSDKSIRQMEALQARGLINMRYPPMVFPISFFGMNSKQL